MAVLYAEDGSILRGVKNLGWLLRNWKHAQRIQVEPIKPAPGCMSEARLVVYLDPSTAPGRTYRYETLFGSSVVLWDWLRNKPTLCGLPLNWGATSTTVQRHAKYPGQPSAPARV